MKPSASEIDVLIALLAKLPGLGPRSAQRAALHLMRRREQLLVPLAEAVSAVADKVRPCAVCGNVALAELCEICADPGRDQGLICVVEEVGDLWALERAGVFRGRYHVLGGLLSALDGVGPEELRIPALARRAAESGVQEVILGLRETPEGQTTAHVIAEHLRAAGATRVTKLARGVPVGGEVGYLDDGTLGAALGARYEV